MISNIIWAHGSLVTNIVIILQTPDSEVFVSRLLQFQALTSVFIYNFRKSFYNIILGLLIIQSSSTLVTLPSSIMYIFLQAYL